MDAPGPPRPGPRRTLTEQDLLDAAFRLLDRGGPRALSVRALASEVGLTPNAVYTYFPTKDALVAAVTDTLLGRAPVAVLTDAGRPWRDRVIAFALGLRSLLLDHPGTVPLLLASGFRGPHALAVGEGLLAALGDGGLVPDDAARASYALTTHLLGTVALDVAEPDPAEPDGTGSRGTGAARDEEARAARRTRELRALPADAAPRTVAAAAAVGAYNTTTQYRWGLERLLDGVCGDAASDS
ncbi:TetR/AcrR family transcriptional regulator [Myceligenerans crystallogenes]|uniref:HTH tetR-type domain-containing protein n=1 Tax=Myceligenerans crystallogenes TaxID=316335 RepID=A0ABP4ZUR6_9MICO